MMKPPLQTFLFVRTSTHTSVLFLTTTVGLSSAYRSSEHLSFSLPSFVLVLSREFIKENTKEKKERKHALDQESKIQEKK